jgi:hypothetical protein
VLGRVPTELRKPTEEAPFGAVMVVGDKGLEPVASTMFLFRSAD